jgi:hypothetical protein
MKWAVARPSVQAHNPRHETGSLCAHSLCSRYMPCVVIQADEALEASGLCYKIQNFLNALATYTDTLCIPALGQQGVTFLLLSKGPILSVEASKKAWLVVTVGAVGKVMNMHHTVKASDMKLMKNRQGFKYPVDLAKRLQRQAAEEPLQLQLTSCMVN